MDTVIVSSHDGWGQIQINRAEKRNALNQETRRGLCAALQSLQGRVRAVVITGTDAWFCCGADVKERAQRLADGLPDHTGAEGIELAMQIRNFPGITIAAVNGLALGYGVNLVNCCDLAVATDSAKFGLPELRSASYASMSAATTQLAGLTRKRLAWMLFNTEPITSQTALDWGLINDVVTADELELRAHSLAQKIAGFDAIAIAETKKALASTDLDPLNWRAAMQSGQDVNPRIRQLRANPKAD